jgi:SAM-dependent methyltransferase
MVVADTGLDTLEQIDWAEVDFVDLGCSTGGSLRHCLGKFKVARGIGIDLDPTKVARTREAGFDAVLADARELRLEGQVSFMSMLDFCEHLPNLDTVFQVLQAAADSAKDFLYIKHPSFEGEDHVESLGVRQYWWDWHGHTAHVRIADYCEMFDALGLRTYMIRFLGRITHSDHPSIIPTSAPQDQSESLARDFVDVPDVVFSPPLWRRQDIFVALRPFEPAEWAAITQPSDADLALMGESGQLRDQASQ